MENEFVVLTGTGMPGVDFARSLPNPEDFDCASDPLSRGAEFFELSYEF